MSDTGPNERTSDRGDDLPEEVRARLDQDFVIGEPVGRGGMATVWRATRRRDQAEVAIKVLRPVLAESVSMRRFLREVEIAAETHSEHLVPLEESGEAEGLPYYVMPFIAGGSLRQRLERERQLPVEDAVRIGRAIALALATLHRNGIVHRDVKPENVLLRGQDVLVADYGIARALSASAAETLTSTGIVVGTPAYMSPEQAGGDPVEARSDQYSWGCVIFEMLIGVQPFQGATTQAVIARHRGEPPPSMRLVRPSIPASLEEVVFKALGKYPADRFDTVESLIAALDRVDLTDLLSTRRRTWRRLAATGAAVAIGAAGTLYGWRLTHPPLDPGRMMFFPLRAADSIGQVEADRVSRIVRGAIEEIEPQLLVQATPQLSASGTSSPVDAQRARALTRRAGARFYVTGTLERLPGVAPGRLDSVRATVTLHDIEGEPKPTIIRAGEASAVSDVALSAVVGLLPRVTGLERQINPASLLGRSPAVVSNWLRGEREYRSSRMRTALEYLRRAVNADSSLAPAAMRAALAALWLNEEREAMQLISLAQRHGEMLSARQAAFAQAVRLYLAGSADSAVTSIRGVLAADTLWAEPWMLTGEIFLHLIPRVPLDSQVLREVPPPVTWPLERWAEEAFRRASAVDPGFTAPLAHLAQIAARRMDISTLEALQEQLRSAGADSTTIRGLALVHRCLTSRMSLRDWTNAARAFPYGNYYAGTVLTNGSTIESLNCADGAWSGLIESDSATASTLFVGIASRFGMNVATVSNDAALALIDSVVAAGMNSALGLYLVGAAAGVDPGQRVDAFVSQLDAAIETRPAPSLWLLSLWSARTADTSRLSRVRARLQQLKSGSGTRLDTLIDNVAAAYQSLARRDTTGALQAFGALTPTGPTTAVQGTLWESLAPERLVYARLLLATGSPAAAHRVASMFDQPGILLNQLFLRPSLELRADAARALGDETLRRSAEDRLRRLKR